MAVESGGGEMTVAIEGVWVAAASGGAERVEPARTVRDRLCWKKCDDRKHSLWEPVFLEGIREKNR